MADIKMLISDYESILREANSMGCKEIRALHHIPLEVFVLIISALKMKERYETQWANDIENPLEPLKLSSALNSEIFKLKYREEHTPKEINDLDFTIIYALQDCLNRYSKQEFDAHKTVVGMRLDAGFTD